MKIEDYALNEFFASKGFENFSFNFFQDPSLYWGGNLYFNDDQTGYCLLFFCFNKRNEFRIRSLTKHQYNVGSEFRLHKIGRKFRFNGKWKTPVDFPALMNDTFIKYLESFGLEFNFSNGQGSHIKGWESLLGLIKDRYEKK